MLYFIGFTLIFLQHLLIEILVLNSNEKIHEDMVMGIVRSPLSYFDVTPSGQITNKFSNDLGLLDNLLALTLIFVLERFMVWIVMLGGSLTMNIIYVIPFGGCLIFSIIFFNFSSSKNLEGSSYFLSNKTETINKSC